MQLHTRDPAIFSFYLINSICHLFFWKPIDRPYFFFFFFIPLSCRIFLYFLKNTLFSIYLHFNLVFYLHLHSGYYNIYFILWANNVTVELMMREENLLSHFGWNELINRKKKKKERGVK